MRAVQRGETRRRTTSRRGFGTGEGIGLGGFVLFCLLLALRIMAMNGRHERYERQRAEREATDGDRNEYASTFGRRETSAEYYARIDAARQEQERRTSERVRRFQQEEAERQREFAERIRAEREENDREREERAREREQERREQERESARRTEELLARADPRARAVAANPFSRLIEGHFGGESIDDDPDVGTANPPRLDPLHAVGDQAISTLRKGMQRMSGTWGDRANRKIFLEFTEKPADDGGIAYWLHVRYAERLANGRIRRDAKGQDVYATTEALLHTNELNQFVADLGGRTILVAGRDAIVVSGPQLQGTFGLVRR